MQLALGAGQLAKLGNKKKNFRLGAALQRFLRANGMAADAGEVDGRFGDQCLAALRTYMGSNRGKFSEFGLDLTRVLVPSETLWLEVPDVDKLVAVLEADMVGPGVEKYCTAQLATWVPAAAAPAAAPAAAA